MGHTKKRNINMKNLWINCWNSSFYDIIQLIVEDYGMQVLMSNNIKKHNSSIFCHTDTVS